MRQLKSNFRFWISRQGIVSNFAEVPVDLFDW